MIDKKWCDIIQIHNPYVYSWNKLLTYDVPAFDKQAFNKYPLHNYIYDKLFIAQSQNINSGLLSNIEFNNITKEYPIFIKPRWGHRSASSKNCYKITNNKQLEQFMHIPDMMWSTYINEREGMTDYFILNGNIMDQMTLVYSDEQLNDTSDSWKYISKDNKPPDEINNWIKQNLSDYSGVCNIQYRGNKIIEVSLRLSRGGAYVYSTNNINYINNINNISKSNPSWNSSLDLNYKPFYAFKCYTNLCLIYLLPRPFLNKIVEIYGGKEFKEYYFEPLGKSGLIYYQFMHDNFKKGMIIKKMIETFTTISNSIILLLLIIISYAFIFKKNQLFNKCLILLIVIYFTILYNSLIDIYNLYKSTKLIY